MRQSSIRMLKKSMLIDVHSHVFTPRLVETLRRKKKDSIVYGSGGKDFLASLPNEVGGVKEIGSRFWSRSERLSFMDRHRIDMSIVSLAVPCLESFSPSEAIEAATEINEDLEKFCFDPSQGQGHVDSPASVFSAGDARSNFSSPISSSSRIRAFGSLPLTPGLPVSELVSSLHSISKSKCLSGAIIGSLGLGEGLDDPELEKLWESAEKSGQVLFLHPSDVIGSDPSQQEGGLWGNRDSRRVLPLALGLREQIFNPRVEEEDESCVHLSFHLELGLRRLLIGAFDTTSAATRLILAGVFDRYPNLKILLAHSGAALPLLSSRLANCVVHEPGVRSRLKHDPRYYLGKFYYDASCYGPEELEFITKIIGRSQRFRRGGAGLYGTPRIGSEEEKTEREFGSKRLLFGTDYPLFPPIGREVEESSAEQPQWMSVAENLNAVNSVRSWGREERERVMFRNAVDLFDLKLE